jgi:hypothetical protein
MYIVKCSPCRNIFSKMLPILIISRAGRLKNWGLIPGWGTYFSVPQDVQTVSGAPQPPTQHSILNYWHILVLNFNKILSKCISFWTKSIGTERRMELTTSICVHFMHFVKEIKINFNKMYPIRNKTLKLLWQLRLKLKIILLMGTCVRVYQFMKPASNFS